MIIDLGLNWNYYAEDGKRYRTRYEEGKQERQVWQESNDNPTMGRWEIDIASPTYKPINNLIDL